MCAKANIGISTHMRVSVSPTDICSASAYGPSLEMAPAATRMEIAIDCQNEKNKMPLTHRNFGTGLLIVRKAPAEEWQTNPPKRFQILVDTKPKHCQAIQAQTNASVVDDADVEVARICPKVSFVKFTERFQDESSRS
jgi:hypothetical protein